MQATATAALETAPRDLFTVEQFAERRPAWSASALRNLILNSEDRFNSRGARIPGNGLAEAGAIVRVRRRVLIDEQAFFRWLADQQRATRRNAARPGASQSKILAESGEVLLAENGDHLALDGRS